MNLTPEAVVEGAVRIEDDRIVGIGDVERGANETVDARERLVLPGLIDLHGDDIESHLHPRSGARMDTHMALASADRANVAAGITTKFHAISFEVDPEENRSPELGAEITDAVERADDLMADHRIHARCEVTQERCVEAVEEAEAMIEKRGGLELSTIRKRVNRVVEAAHDHGVPTASHDDEEVGEVERLHDVGVDISEYPITLATAERAHELGMTVTMGAPNLVRSESQWGNLRTANAIEAGVVDALVADYHPISLLAAPFVDTGDPLPERVARVTKHPADAVGLSDRGRVAEGARVRGAGRYGRLAYQVSSLAEHLDDDQELVRYHLCRALVLVGCDAPEKLAAARDVLAARLTDENAYVRGRAAEALGLLARPEATDSMRPESELVTVADDQESFAAERARFALEATRGGDASRDAADGIGTVESVRGTTQGIIGDITALDTDNECPHCGLALPESGPPMCPRCGAPY